MPITSLLDVLVREKSSKGAAAKLLDM